MFILLLGVSSAIFLQFSEAYVLLQVRKHDGNHSNVDALIHKVVPSDKLEKFSQKMARKQFTDSNTEELLVESEQKRIKYPVNKENKIKQDDGYRKQDGDYNIIQDGNSKKKQDGDFSVGLDEKNAAADLVKLVDVALKQLSKSGGSVMRTSDHDQASTLRTIKFRSGESSILYEINSQSVIGVIKELLSSKIVRNYIDTLTRKAAVVYRAMTGPNNNE